MEIKYSINIQGLTKKSYSELEKVIKELEKIKDISEYSKEKLNSARFYQYLKDNDISEPDCREILCEGVCLKDNQNWRYFISDEITRPRNKNKIISIKQEYDHKELYSKILKENEVSEILFLKYFR